MTDANPQTVTATKARIAAGAFPDAPLAMPVQDMSPAPVGASLREMILSALRRARGGKVAGH